MDCCNPCIPPGCAYDQKQCFQGCTNYVSDPTTHKSDGESCIMNFLTDHALRASLTASDDSDSTACKVAQNNVCETLKSLATPTSKIKTKVARGLFANSVCCQKNAADGNFGWGDNTEASYYCEPPPPPSDTISSTMKIIGGATLGSAIYASLVTKFRRTRQNVGNAAVAGAAVAGAAGNEFKDLSHDFNDQYGARVMAAWQAVNVSRKGARVVGGYGALSPEELTAFQNYIRNDCPGITPRTLIHAIDAGSTTRFRRQAMSDVLDSLKHNPANWMGRSLPHFDADSRIYAGLFDNLTTLNDQMDGGKGVAWDTYVERNASMISKRGTEAIVGRMYREEPNDRVYSIAERGEGRSGENSIDDVMADFNPVQTLGGSE